ncbi:sigma factor-like helix-turn-helix DNA-binding protein [Nocardioides sp. B-3]|uniref:sigma factor-like helix-turn-helix DNA-binding protein n=1 Tax=Nocardioides sp. B-3 TaxID=2895565 RepID=UPI0021535F96|nr:sigma factor-like helix-turn-helix DNA-binding protein [Nocardioides sp. B-3]UUZ58821.1 hypothetical protein LP418_22470 [Nocardioides sp. B-3]
MMVRPALRSLPERDRRVLYLRFFEGLTQIEIGNELGVGRAQVSRLITRAPGDLRDQLTGPGGPVGQPGVCVSPGWQTVSKIAVPTTPAPMHHEREVGYGAGMIDQHPVDRAREVSTGEELAQLLHAQHAELSGALCRIPRLHDGGREDVFLRARRHLAVHTALEVVVLAPRLLPVPDHFRLDTEVPAGEGGAVESIEFDAAHARLTVAFLHHVQLQERQDLTGPLSERERTAVEVAVQLWNGDGDVYLGSTWAEMVTTACEHVAGDASPVLPAPRRPR